MFPTRPTSSSKIYTNFTLPHSTNPQLCLHLQESKSIQNPTLHTPKSHPIGTSTAHIPMNLHAIQLYQTFLTRTCSAIRNTKIPHKIVVLARNVNILSSHNCAIHQENWTNNKDKEKRYSKDMSDNLVFILLEIRNAR